MAIATPGGLSPADLDADGDVDLADFSIFTRMMGQATGVLYVWDAENRLVEVVPGMPASGPRDPKTKFTYDHMGRRVRTRTFTWNTGTSAWNTAAATDTKFVYDGWRVIMELDGINDDEIARKYTWGLDLSGSLEGAGGIGGLLATEDMGDTETPATGDERTFIYTYDGNGNVGQLIETTSGANHGTVQAHYEYHLYGKRLNAPAQGEYDQPYRFSTKPFDETTSLGYWGYRYYNSDLGRWMNRDPIEEGGGPNLYAYCAGTPSQLVDPFGLGTYHRGEPQRPNIHHDNGFLDVYPPRQPTVLDAIALAKWRAKVAAAKILRPDLDDAIAAYLHFLYGNGTDFYFSYQEYLDEDPAGEPGVDREITDAKSFAEQLAQSNNEVFSMTGTPTDPGYPQTENWQKAIGAHTIWGSADVRVTCGSAGKRRFVMIITIHAEDRYNFNPGQSDIATGTPDSVNGRFEITGLAKQFNQYGQIRRQIEWMEGESSNVQNGTSWVDRGGDR